MLLPCFRSLDVVSVVVWRGQSSLTAKFGSQSIFIEVQRRVIALSVQSALHVSPSVFSGVVSAYRVQVRLGLDIDMNVDGLSAGQAEYLRHLWRQYLIDGGYQEDSHVRQWRSAHLPPRPIDC
jgi:hypothetical protein